MVVVVVGRAAQTDVAELADEPAEVDASSIGPGSTTTTWPAPGSRSTHVLVPSSVIMFGFGASRHSPRSPYDPPLQPVTAAAGPPRSPAVAGQGIDRVQPSPSGSTDGVNILSTERDAATASASSGESCSPTSIEG